MFSGQDTQDPPKGEVNSTKKAGLKRQLLHGVEDFFDGELLLIESFIEMTKAAALFEYLYKKLRWQQDRIKVYGKWHVIPRLQAWHGNADAVYQYSGVEMQPCAWDNNLLKLKQHCELATGCAFNSVLANLYRNGQDCMGFHSDDEPELGDEPVIASVSLGGIRNFDLIHKHKPYKLRVPLQPGSLLVMKGRTQDFWLHGIARTRQVKDARINLTFRHILAR